MTEETAETAASVPFAESDAADLLVLGYWLRDGCYCGQAKGHPGWLTCLERKARGQR